MSDLVYNMINCDKPIVSAINGVAVGAGTVAALLADIAIAAEDAQDRRRARQARGGGRRPRRHHLAAAGRHGQGPLLPADRRDDHRRRGRADRHGGQGAAPGPGPRRGAADRRQLATGSQQAIRLTKRALNNWLRAAGPTFDQSAAYEMLTFLGPDVMEGYAALREKRPPRGSRSRRGGWRPA